MHSVRNADKFLCEFYSHICVVYWIQGFLQEILLPLKSKTDLMLPSGEPEYQYLSGALQTRLEQRSLLPSH